MHPEPTPGVRRAFSAANRWSAGAEQDLLGPVELLLGLLDEPECRAATFLADVGVSASKIREQWPEVQLSLGSGDAERPWSDEVRTLVTFAQSWLAQYSDTQPLATEHVLLGMLSEPNKVAAWLTSLGLHTSALETTICELYGHSNEPLEYEEETCDVVSPVESEEAATQDDIGLADRQSTDVPHAVGSQYVAQTPPEDIGVLRILDAAANRASEALRVVDDYARFVLDDRHLTEQFKALRHGLAAAMSRIETDSLLAARETLRDVGTEVSNESEYQRQDADAVVVANIHRAQEALRTLEEYGKVIDSSLGGAFEALRYQSYTLQRALHTSARSVARLHEARLYVLVSGGSSEQEMASLVEVLITAGVDVIQLRDKQLDDRQLLQRANVLRELTHGTPTLIIVNDRPDIARLSNADGVHVGQNELSVLDARRIVGPSPLIGVSTHSIEQARQAVMDGANYIGVGPTFPSTTKSFQSFTGVDLLRAVAKEIGLPAFAIGGIDASNVDQVLAAGVGRVAVSGAISSAVNPAAAAGELIAKLKASPLRQ